MLTKDSKFLLGDYPIDIKTNKEKNKYTLSKLEWDLGEYYINLDDNKNKQKVQLHGDYLEHGNYVRNKHVNLATKGSFVVDNKPTAYMADISVNLPINRFSEDKLKIAANLQNFDLASVSDYVNIVSKGKIKKLGGIINFNADTSPDKFGHKKLTLLLLQKNWKFWVKIKLHLLFTQINLLQK